MSVQKSLPPRNQSPIDIVSATVLDEDVDRKKSEH